MLSGFCFADFDQNDKQGILKSCYDDRSLSVSLKHQISFDFSQFVINNRFTYSNNVVFLIYF